MYGVCTDVCLMFLRQGLSDRPRLANQARPAGQQAPRILPSVPLALDVSVYHHIWFFPQVLELNYSWSHACIASTLPTERAQHCLFKCMQVNAILLLINDLGFFLTRVPSTPTPGK